MKIEEVIEILENGGWWDLLIPMFKKRMLRRKCVSL